MEPRPPVLGSQSFSHWTTSFLLFFKKKDYLFIFGGTGSLLLRGLFSSCGERGLLWVHRWVRGLLTAVASLDVEHRPQGTGSAVVARGLSVGGELAVELTGCKSCGAWASAVSAPGLYGLSTCGAQA